jgi:hypothetical protein
MINEKLEDMELMVLMGGFAPSAMNDVWVTEDGVVWL